MGTLRTALTMRHLQAPWMWGQREGRAEPCHRLSGWQ